MKKRIFLILTIGCLFCSLTAYAAIVANNSDYTVEDDNIYDEDDLLASVSDASRSAAKEDKINDSIATVSNATRTDYDMFLPLSQTDDFNEIQDLEDAMIAHAEYLYEMGEINKKIYLSDIEYDKAVKIFMDGEDSIVNINDLNMDSLIDYVSSLEYIWEIPVDIGNQTISYTFNIGKELSEDLVDILTEEQQEEVNNNAGKWMIVRVSWNKNKVVDYKQYTENTMSQNQIDDNGISVLIGGIPNVYQPVVITIVEDEAYAIPSCEATTTAMNTLSKTGRARTADSTKNIMSFSDLQNLTK